jgi:hypothetical protein
MNDSSAVEILQSFCSVNGLASMPVRQLKRNNEVGETHNTNTIGLRVSPKILDGIAKFAER